MPGMVRVERKGGKEDTIPLNDKACRAVKNWLKGWPKVDHDGLVVSKPG
jgi:site-specific recombinase XerC